MPSLTLAPACSAGVEPAQRRGSDDTHIHANAIVTHVVSRYQRCVASQTIGGSGLNNNTVCYYAKGIPVLWPTEIGVYSPG